jgi:GNAT superfamily N-acetyltransferase
MNFKQYINEEKMELDVIDPKDYACEIEDELKEKYKEYLTDLSITKSTAKKALLLNNIVIKKEYRSKGIGRKIIEDLIKYADENNWIITLSPSSYYGIPEQRLKEYYKSFGFEDNTDSRFIHKMIRKPVHK